MVIDTIRQLSLRHQALGQWPETPVPNRVLMAEPDYFDIVYAINPFMQDETGSLKKVNHELAMKQWQTLRKKYETLGFEVSIIDAVEGLPDLVFCANQSFPFWNSRTGRACSLIGQMRSEFRRPEVDLFVDWYRTHGYEIYCLSDQKLCFEGNGDALLHPGRALIWGGFGGRTDKFAYSEISDITGYDVILLPITKPDFYHLDTCFSILNETTAVIQPNAFSDEAQAMISAFFPNVIETTFEDCTQWFTGNCHSPNGKDVILQKGASAFEKELQKAGFNVHPVDTSEYMKSGGSVFCMKMMCY